MILIDVSLILADSTMKNMFFPETVVFFLFFVFGKTLWGWLGELAGWVDWLAGLLAGWLLAGWLDGWSAGVAQPAPESFLKKEKEKKNVSGKNKFSIVLCP